MTVHARAQGLVACILGLCLAAPALPDTGRLETSGGSYSEARLMPGAPGPRAYARQAALEAATGREDSPRRKMILARLRPPTASPSPANIRQASLPGSPIAPEQLAGLLDIIGAVEAGTKGYDAVQLRARIKPPRPPSTLTLGEILDWIEATPRQQHAIGRYQIIPSTLRSLIRQMDISPETRFSPQLQDAMALRLLKDAGLRDFAAGRKTADEFMDAVAWIWAGLPLRTGRSAYHGFNGNYAVISRREYKAAFDGLFSPQRSQNIQRTAGP